MEGKATFRITISPSSWLGWHAYADPEFGPCIRPLKAFGLTVSQSRRRIERKVDKWHKAQKKSVEHYLLSKSYKY